MKNRMKLEFDSISANEAFARVTVAAFMAQMNPSVEEVADVNAEVEGGKQVVETSMNVADLNATNLHYANLHGADVRGADLYGAYLRDANLRHADLRGASLREADLSGADLRGAKF